MVVLSQLAASPGSGVARLIFFWVAYGFSFGWPPSKIQRRGRWLSDCWLLYIWPDREEATGLIEDVVSSPAPLFHIKKKKFISLIMLQEYG